MKEISVALKLCSKLLCKIQPPLINFDSESEGNSNIDSSSPEGTCDTNESPSENETVTSSDENETAYINNELDQTVCYTDSDSDKSVTYTNGVRSIITLCEEKFQNLVVTFIREKMIANFSTSLSYYQSLLLPKEGGKLQREMQLDSILRKCLTLKKQSPSSVDIFQFKKDITEDVSFRSDSGLSQVEMVIPSSDLCQAFGQLSHLLKELSSFPSFYTNSKALYDKHMRAGKLFYAINFKTRF